MSFLNTFSNNGFSGDLGNTFGGNAFGGNAFGGNAFAANGLGGIPIPNPVDVGTVNPAFGMTDGSNIDPYPTYIPPPVYTPKKSFPWKKLLALLCCLFWTAAIATMLGLIPVWINIANSGKSSDTTTSTSTTSTSTTSTSTTTTTATIIGRLLHQ